MRSPIPTQIVSSDEYPPPPQTAAPREVQARLGALGAALAKKHAMTRRRFFQTAAGMAAAYHVMNQVYGPLFDAPAAEAAAPERARALAGQMICDAHTHFVCDDPSRAQQAMKSVFPTLSVERQPLSDLPRTAARSSPSSR